MFVICKLIYSITCRACEEEIGYSEIDNYIGMSRTTVYCRMTGHLKDQKAKLNKSPMHRHDWINTTDSLRSMWQE